MHACDVQVPSVVLSLDAVLHLVWSSVVAVQCATLCMLLDVHTIDLLKIQANSPKKMQCHATYFVYKVGVMGATLPLPSTVDTPLGGPAHSTSVSPCLLAGAELTSLLSKLSPSARRTPSLALVPQRTDPPTPILHH